MADRNKILSVGINIKCSSTIRYKAIRFPKTGILKKFELLEKFIDVGIVIEHEGSKVHWEIEKVESIKHKIFNQLFPYLIENYSNKQYTIKSKNSSRRKRIDTRDLNRDYSFINISPALRVLFLEEK